MKRSKRHLTFAGHLMVDLLLFAAALLIFAYFHHVRPQPIPDEGILIPPVIDTETDSTNTDTDFPTDTENKDSSEEKEPTWAEKFSEKFSETVRKTETSYQSPNCAIFVEKHSESIGGSEVTYYVADIYITDISCFRTAFSSSSGYEPVLNIAERNNAIVAISGDYYAIHRTTSVIRNGRLYREGNKGDVCVLYSNGEMDVIAKNSFDTAQVVAAGAYQTWDFGPNLLNNGQAINDFSDYSSISGRNPRTAIGYYEPGHYCFVLVDGRQSGYSSGLTLSQMSSLFEELGCKEAYNLDGGQSAVMTFQGKWANQPYKNGRNVSDIIYIGEPES